MWISWYWWIMVYPIVTFLAFLIVRDLISFFKTIKYKKQGFLRLYTPILAQISLFLPNKKVPEDCMYNFKSKIDKARNHPGLVMNDTFGGTALIYLTNLELIKEFYLKETAVSKRAELGDLKVDFSFFLDNSEHGMTHRRIFSELFQVENISKNIPHMKQVSQKMMVDLVGGDSGNFDFKAHTVEILKATANKLLFGEEEELPRCKDQERTSVTDMVFSILKEVGSFKGIMHPLNLLFFGLPNKYNLLQASRNAAKNAKLLSQALEESFTKRMTDPKYKLGVNILDLMVRYNKMGTGYHFKPNDIVGDTVLFLFAGSDSTSKTLTSCIYFLSKNPEWIEKIRSDIVSLKLTRLDVSFEDLDKSDALNAVIKETLRFRSPGPASFDKLILKDFDLGQYHFSAGDKIVIPFCYHSNSVEYFDEPNAWNPNNFMPGNPKKIPSMAFIPFSAGRRGCIGKLLAETIIKVNLIEILESYDLWVDKEDKNAWRLTIGVDIDHCNVKVTKRRIDIITKDDQPTAVPNIV